MPTISIKKKDLESLTGMSFPLDDLEHPLQLVKGELKGYDEGTDELKIELSDSNRPDLWCCEGIARQIRGKLTGAWRDYEFFYSNGCDKAGEIIVSAEMRDIRPYVGGLISYGVTGGDGMMVQV